MLTRRGWAMAVVGIILTGIGLIRWIDGFTYLGICLLGWLVIHWLSLRWATATLTRDLEIVREVRDRGGPCRTLRDGQTLEVRCSAVWHGGARLPLVRLEDRPPADMIWLDRPKPPRSWFSVPARSFQWPCMDGTIPGKGILNLVWRGKFSSPGVARFEGARVTVLDPQGIVGVSVFIRAASELLVLPDPGHIEDPSGGTKKANNLLPPGQHRLRKAGGSSEILDVRDYIPGDSPRHIAWKLSARRDKVIVRDFESEVPVRCQLVVDGTRPLRKWQPGGARLGKLANSAAGILEHSLEQRDPVGVILAEEDKVVIRQPGGGARHRLRVLQTLAEGCATPGVTPPREEDPLPLFAPALRVARELYPDVARASFSQMPWRWILWGPPRPGFSRYGGFLGWVYRHRGYTWFVPPLLMVTSYVIASGWMCMAVPLAGPALWIVVRIASFFPQWQLRDRKVLATVLAAREGGGNPALLDALLEDDTLLATRLRAFLADHREDRKLVAPPPATLRVQSAARAERLSVAMLSAVARARDPELHVLFTDTEDLGARVDALEKAVRVSRARRHEVLVVLAESKQGIALTDGEVEAGLAGGKSLARSAGFWIRRLMGKEKAASLPAKVAISPQLKTKLEDIRKIQDSEAKALEDLRKRLGKLGVTIIHGAAAPREAQKLVARLRRTGARLGIR